MTNNRTDHVVASRMTTLAMAVTLLLPSFALAQSPDVLQVTSPADGAVVSPGDTLTVTVTSPANASFDIGLVGGGAIGIVDALATSAPAQFSVPIPADMASRTYILTTSGTTTSGQDASAQVTIDVEKPDLPWSLAAQLTQIIFDG